MKKIICLLIGLIFCLSSLVVYAKDFSLSDVPTNDYSYSDIQICLNQG